MALLTKYIKITVRINKVVYLVNLINSLIM